MYLKRTKYSNIQNRGSLSSPHNTLMGFVLLSEYRAIFFPKEVSSCRGGDCYLRVFSVIYKNKF